MKRDSSSPEAYRKTIEGEQLEVFDRIRRLISEIAPEAKEGMDYGMPTYFIGDKNYVSLAAQKHHVGLYVGIATLDECKGELTGIDRGNSCLRFKRIAGLPEEAIRTVLIRAKENCGDGC